MQFTGSSSEFLELELITGENSFKLTEPLESGFSLLWFNSNGNKLKIDEVEYVFNTNQVVCLTDLHKVIDVNVKKLNLLRFNRPFYCIIDNDSEVSCKGILFFGASQVPYFTITGEVKEKFEIVWRMFQMEVQSRDELQLEMLQMMLKRFLILCARLYKSQNAIGKMEKASIDVVREFNYLVEKHFKEKHTVAEYSDMLNKSPKTLSNLFGKMSSKSPLQFIQERRLLESKRLLGYTAKPVKEIAFELGFEDIQGFSRFFKAKNGESPAAFRKKLAGQN